MVLDPVEQRGQLGYVSSLTKVITDMIDEDGFRVSIADTGRIKAGTGTDFRIIAGFAVSRFMAKGRERALVECFSAQEIARARMHWRNILEVRIWDSTESEPIQQWAEGHLR